MRRKHDPRQTGSLFVILGSFSLMIVLVLNLAVALIFRMPGAAFFSDAWWSQWFPAYACWLTFLVLGLAMGARSLSSPGARRNG